MMPGENAPPMHPHCRCSTAAWEDDADYEAWLDHLEKGGTTKEWDAMDAALRNQQISAKRAELKLGLENSENGAIITADNAATTDLQSDFGKLVDSQKPVEKDYASEIKTVYNRGTANAKKVFNKFVKPDSVASTTSPGSYFDRTKKKVYLNASKDFNQRIGVGAKYFHEHGHYIDFFAAGANNGNFISMQNAKFGQKLRADYDAYLQRIINSNGVSQTRAEGILEAELKNWKKHGISDIVDGLTDGKVYGCASHFCSDPKYWHDPGRIEREAFANMYQSCFEPESAKYMAEYFPEAYKEFKKMIKGLI